MLREVNGIRLNVLIEGGGPPLVFLHGLGGSWRAWEPQLDSLTGQYRCIVPELRGHGRSDLGEEPLSTALFASDVIALTRSLGISRAGLVGLSMGGHVAQVVALRAASIFCGLVLADTNLGATDEARSALLRRASDTRSGGMEVVLEYYRARTEARGGDPRLRAAVWRDLEGNDPWAYAGALEAIADHDCRQGLGSLRTPTLVVRGSEDSAVSAAEAEQLAAAIPGAFVCTIDGAGHNSNRDRPDEFDRLLLWFLGSPAVGLDGGTPSKTGST